MIAIWPGPLDIAEDDLSSRDWSQLHRTLALIPAGRWTAYSDLAELIGSYPMPVGVHLATRSVDNAWRVLTQEGKPSPQFAWVDNDRTQTQREVLESEGVRFDKVVAIDSVDALIFFHESLSDSFVARRPKVMFVTPCACACMN